MRVPYWSEAAAIGSEAFVKQLAGRATGGRIDVVPAASIGEEQAMYTLTLPTRDQRALWAQRQT